MVNNLVAALHDDIQTLSWMSPETTKQALAKLAAFTRKSAIRTSGAIIRRTGGSRAVCAGNQMRARAI